jgi:lauroyl/myristoyl acyltransferase
VPAFLTCAVYRLLGALTGPLPPQIGYSLARRAGGLLYRFSPNLRQVLAHNIRHVIGPQASDKELEALTRQACVNVAKGHYDLFRVSRLTTDQILDMIRIEGWQHVIHAMERGKGVIVISAHTGNVDIVAQAPVVHGLPMSGPVMHVQPECLFRYALKLRQSHGLRLLPADGLLLGLVRALKRNELVALPVDRVISDNTRRIMFFGSPTDLPDGPLRLAYRTGAAVVPAFALRLPDDTFLIQVEPPLDLPDTGQIEADIAAGMEKVARITEAHISRHPEQWLVAAPLWPEDA